ncbi:WD40-repeat-containing domain protein [Dipodascopsis tothii]|uniref:WD40-repeat-containing domain protein n=1 Tax=Dipodascopsis tothii TaxID=44089 RepID=UPI0034CE1331
MSKKYFATTVVADAHPSDIYGLDTTPSVVVSASGDSAVRVWAASGDHAPLYTISTAHRVGIHHVATCTERGLVAFAGFDGTISIWTLAEPAACLVTISDDKVSFWAIRFSPEGEYLAATSLDGKVYIYSVGDDSSTLSGVLDTRGTPGLSLDYSLNARFIASGHENGGVYIFSTETARLLHSLPGHVKAVRAVAFSPKSSLLAAAGDSSIITLYDVKSGEQIFNLAGHTKWVMSLDWNFTGEQLLSAAFDSSLRVWSIEQRENVATHTEADSMLWTARWVKAPTGPDVFVSGGFNALRFYREATGTGGQ